MRRDVLAGLGIGLGALAVPARASAPPPRQRVIVDNDFGGDPDGLFALAHHLLSPSVDIALVVGSHLHAGEPFDKGPHQAANAAARAHDLASLLGRVGNVPILPGADALWSADRAPTPASQAIVEAVMMHDTRLPVFYAAGAGLTELAAAHRLEPRIASRIRLVWIGGMEHADLHPDQPPRTDPEYNMTIDLAAARYVFNETGIEIWQVPRDAYRRMLISRAELIAGLAPSGELGAWLLARIEAVRALVADAGIDPRETYILGDSPLVTLTALQSTFEADASSSDYVLRPAPMLDEAGRYLARPSARPMRIYRTIDTRLTFADMFAKFAAARV